MADLLARDNGKFTSIPVMKCILSNDIDELKKLIEKCSDIVNFVHGKSGDTPILVAARYKRFEILKLLYECGADIEHKNIDGKRTLHEAALSGCIDCVGYILQQNVNVDSLKRADWTPLMFAATQGHLDVIKKLVKHGAKLTRVNKDGWNCFHLACREGFVSILEYLLEIHSLLWKTVSNNSRTPLHSAAMHGQLDTVSFLLKHCSYDKDEKDSCGTTPLMDSLRFGFVEIADMLIKVHGADVFQWDFLGRSCLHIAAQSGQVQSLKYLIETCKLNVNLTCLDTATAAIHLAAKEGHIDALSYLISVGAFINIVDKNNRTPLHLATASSKLSVVELLLTNYGADANVIDVSGKKAFQYALTDELKLYFE